ncbi:MAG TPA: hypothetical protein ACFYD3_01630 [Candidatus Hypogeohydataceae bacterium YC41]
MVTGEADLWKVKNDPTTGVKRVVEKYSTEGQGEAVAKNEAVKIVFNRMFLKHMGWTGFGEIVVFAEVQDDPEGDSRLVTKVYRPQIVENAYLNFIDSTIYGPIEFDCTFTFHPVNPETTGPVDVLLLRYGQYLIIKREFEERPEAKKESKAPSHEYPSKT